MGGYGSGRPAYHNKTGSFRAIDLSRLTRGAGTYSWNLGGEPMGSVGYSKTNERIRFSYQRRNAETDEWEPHEVLVRMVTTDTQFGGERRWMACPRLGCNRRCRVIYFGPSGFACRHCYRLRYNSQSQTPDIRAQRRMARIIRRLGGDVGDDFPDKPKGMHWRTYNRLGEQYDDFEDRSYASLEKAMLRIFKHAA